MQSLLTSSQIREADNYTIARKPIASVDLMEAAATAFTEIFKDSYPDKAKRITVYCGTGNNGGDGLAIARLLSQSGYNVLIKIARFNENSSPDFNINLERLKQSAIPVLELHIADDLLEPSDIIIDALLGSGLNKPLAGEWKKLIRFLNNAGKEVVSVDVPSGFASEGPLQSEMVFADLVICFQRPKLNFFLPESAKAVKKLQVADIGLDEDFIQSCKTSYFLLTEQDIRKIIRIREPFSHKGSYGHSLIIAGADETMGAALLCAEACLNTGAGLTTACIPRSGLTALNIRVPEVMAALRVDDSLPDINWEKYTSVAIGPGLSTSLQSKISLAKALAGFTKPLVMDADALNLLSSNPDLLAGIPEGSILTPHVKEFDRLFGEHSCWWERLQTGMKQATLLNSVIVLKNRFTFIFTAEGRCLINPTGSPVMATGGTGDVLTGMIASFLAQGYSSENSAILGVFIHGKAGEALGIEFAVVPAGRLCSHIPAVLKEVTN